MSAHHAVPAAFRAWSPLLALVLLSAGCSGQADRGEDGDGGDGDQQQEEHAGPPAETAEELHTAITRALDLSTVANWEQETFFRRLPEPSGSWSGRLSCDADGSGVYAQRGQIAHPDNETFSPEPNPVPDSETEPDDLPTPVPREFHPDAPVPDAPVKNGFLAGDEAYVSTHAETWMRVPTDSLPAGSFEPLLDCAFFPAVTVLSEDLERVDTEETDAGDLFVWEGSLDLVEAEAADEPSPNPFADADLPGVPQDSTVRMWTDGTNLPHALHMETADVWIGLVLSDWDEGEAVEVPEVGAPVEE